MNYRDIIDVLEFEEQCTEVDLMKFFIKELEKIKEEAQEQMIFRDNIYNKRTEFSITNMELCDIINNHIRKLKEVRDNDTFQ